jgi:hypothetical protein
MVMSPYIYWGRLAKLAHPIVTCDGIGVQIFYTYELKSLIL